MAIRNEFLKYETHVPVTMHRMVTRTRQRRVAKKEKNMTHGHMKNWTNIYSAYIYVHAYRITELRTDVIYKTKLPVLSRYKIHLPSAEKIIIYFILYFQADI
jgi:hypothetical protein